MTKKAKVRIMMVTLPICFVFWVIELVRVISYFANPMSFSFLHLALVMALMFIMLGHWAWYVVIMNDKPKKRKYIEDVENWWEKWDRV
jgi:hypothetical protein